MEKELTFENSEQKFEKTIENLSLTTGRVLLTILIRGFIIDKDEFRHVVGITGETLESALNELKELNIIKEEKGIWQLSGEFNEYWERTKRK